MKGGDAMKMEYSEVYDYSKKFKSESAQLDQIIRRMYQYVDALGAGWDGDAARTFREKLDSMKKSFDDTQKVIADISTGLDLSAKDMEEAEKKMGSRWK